MLKVGLTGGIGSGKSAASRIMDRLGAYVFEADREAKQILATNAVVQNELIAEFGSDILGADETIDRAKLARIALQDEDHQLRLNAIVHPYIFTRLDEQFETVLQNESFPIFVVDGALVYESGYDQHLDYVIVVTALLKNRLERALERGHLTREDILRRMELQWSEEDKISLADFVIHNDGTEEELASQVEAIYRQLV